MVAPAPVSESLLPWLTQLQSLAALRIRVRFDGCGSELPTASAFRGAIGQQLMRSDNQRALAHFFPSTNDQPAESPFGPACPWALHVLPESDELEAVVLSSATAHFDSWVAALFAATRGRIGEATGMRVAECRHQRVIGTTDWATGLPITNARWSIAPPPSGRITLQFESPLRLKRRGADLRPENMQPRDLVANVMRRLTSLLAQQGEPEPTWDAQALLSLASDSQWATKRLKWVLTGRYSQRQHAEMHLGGLLGEATLELSPIIELWPILWMGQFIHAGRTPALGMGRYRIISG